MCMRCKRASTMAQQGLKMQYLACSCTFRAGIQLKRLEHSGREGGLVLYHPGACWCEANAIGRRARVIWAVDGVQATVPRKIKPPLFSLGPRHPFVLSESRCLDPGVLCNMGGAANLPPQLTLVRRAESNVIGDKPQERKQVPR